MDYEYVKSILPINKTNILYINAAIINALHDALIGHCDDPLVDSDQPENPSHYHPDHPNDNANNFKIILPILTILTIILTILTIVLTILTIILTILTIILTILTTLDNHTDLTETVQNQLSLSICEYVNMNLYELLMQNYFTVC